MFSIFNIWIMLDTRTHERDTQTGGWESGCVFRVSSYQSTRQFKQQTLTIISGKSKENHGKSLEKNAKDFINMLRIKCCKMFQRADIRIGGTMGIKPQILVSLYILNLIHWTTEMLLISIGFKCYCKSIYSIWSFVWLGLVSHALTNVWL